MWWCIFCRFALKFEYRSQLSIMSSAPGPHYRWREINAAILLANKTIFVALNLRLMWQLRRFDPARRHLWLGNDDLSPTLTMDTQSGQRACVTCHHDSFLTQTGTFELNKSAMRQRIKTSPSFLGIQRQERVCCLVATELWESEKFCATLWPLNAHSRSCRVKPWLSYNYNIGTNNILLKDYFGVI